MDAHRHFINVPELVEDLAGEILGENFLQLVEAFQIRTVPCVVSFGGHGEAAHIVGALDFLRRVEHGSTELEAAESPTTCYDGAGVSVQPTEILSVERLA